jgi:hypothetical protein
MEVAEELAAVHQQPEVGRFGQLRRQPSPLLVAKDAVGGLEAAVVEQDDLQPLAVGPERPKVYDV